MASRGDGKRPSVAVGADESARRHGGRSASPEQRRSALIEVLGEPDPGFTARGLLEAVRAEAERNWRRHVEPRIALHWPELRSTPACSKIRVAALDFLAYGPYLSLVLGPRRPWGIRLLTLAGRFLSWDSARLARHLARSLPFYARVRLRVEGRRIALAVALVGIVDEALDHALRPMPPAWRVAQIQEAVRSGAGESDVRRSWSHGCLRLIADLVAALTEDLSPEENEELRLVLEDCCGWTRAELARMEARPDPRGLAHRGAGIEAGTRGLAWTVAPWIGSAERDWMRSVCTFVQMVDDWIDLEADLERGERTPVADGVWDLEQIRAAFGRTSEAIVAIAERNGETYPPFLGLLRDSYVERIRELAQKMLSGEAA